MPTPELSDELAQQALDQYELIGDYVAAAKKVGIHKQTFRDRVKIALLRGLKPTVRKDAPRVYNRQRLGRMHLVIPDVQSKPGVRNDHLEWIGHYIVEKKPDVVVCIGDFWDFPSLSRYDKGKLAFEGRRYVDDVKAGQRAMEKLLKPIDDYNRTAEEKYEPEKEFLLGNHEIRPTRLVDDNPEFMGRFDLADLGLRDYGWRVHDFLKVVDIDNIEYSHYFTSGVLGRPVSSAAAMLRERQKSCTMGHVQTCDIAIHRKTQNIGLFCGICYLHNEDYLGPQGNDTRRQIVVCHEVEDGRYDPMLVSLRFLEKNYA